MSVIHLQADTYPYNPGTTVRTGKPCAVGSGLPFIPMASSASLPSIAVCTGVPDVNPSEDVQYSWSAPALIPASRGSAPRLVPSQRALPTYGPPTSLETQVRVM